MYKYLERFFQPDIKTEPDVLKLQVTHLLIHSFTVETVADFAKSSLINSEILNNYGKISFLAA